MSDFDANDPEAVQRQRVALGRQAAADRQVIKNLLSTEPGRSWFWRFLESCHCFSLSFDPDSDRISAFREGERNIGNRLLADLVKSDPESYTLMMKEHNDGRYSP